MDKKELNKAMEEMECWQAISHIKNCPQCFEDAKWICPECEEIRKGDERVKVSMKCMNCAYGN